MKIKIGLYKHHLNTYAIANCFRFIGLSQAACDQIGEWLEFTPVNNLCNWIERHRTRKIQINIDPWDTWNMDHTLSLIILPMLQQLRETKHGAPNVEDSDVPDHLKSTAAEPKANDSDTDTNHFLRWDWVLDEMIWTFEQNVSEWEEQFHTGQYDRKFKTNIETGKTTLVKGPNDTSYFDKTGYEQHFARMQNGMRLFAKYFYNLWD